jgi:hypothetical protein
VIKPLGGDLVTGTGTDSTTRTPTAGVTSEFPTQLPIAIGNKLGIDTGVNASTNYYVAVDPASIRDGYIPLVADGGPARTSNNTFMGREIALNADIEPTSTFTVSGATPLKGGKIQVAVSLPNPGTMTAGDARDTSFAGSAAKKKKKKKKGPRFLLKQAVATPAAPGTATLELLPTKVAKKKLKKKKRVAASIKLSYTPTGGTKTTQTLAVQLKR